MATETNITKGIQKYLKSREGWWGIKVWGSVMTQAGVPDIVGCYRGVFVGFEVKTPVGTVSRIQEHCHTLIQKANGWVFVVHNKGEVADALEMIDEGLAPA